MSQALSPTLRRFLALLLVIALGLAVLVLNKWRFDSSSRELAIAVTQSVLSTGNAEMLVEHADPALLADTDSNSLQRYVDAVILNLGTPQTIVAINGGSSGNILDILLGSSAASYEISLDYAGTATPVHVSLRRTRGEWWVNGFFLDSALLYN